MKDAVIVSAVRTAIGKAPAGTLRFTRPDEMAATVIREALARAPGLDPAEIDDVILGCAMLAGAPYTLLKGAVYIHPTLAEGFFSLMDAVRDA